MSSKRILLVEDELLIALDIESALTELGHQVQLAMTCEEAAACLATGWIDLAILDYHLQDGTTTTPIADRLHEAGIPFIVCSGTAGLEELSVAFAGASVLSKPFSTDGLVTAVERATTAHLH